MPGSLPGPPGTANAVAWLFREKRADVFLSYCTNGGAAAAQFALFILSPAGQKILAEHGFDAPLLP